MEQSAELQKENTRLRDHLMELQNKLEELEKENVKLQDQIKRLKRRLQESELSETSDGTRCCSVLYKAVLLSPSAFSYSQQNLTEILQRVALPSEVIQFVTVQIELDYQR